MKCAILDDYQRVAANYFDLGRKSGASKGDGGLKELEVDYFHEPLTDRKQLVAALKPYAIIVAMRERTPFPAELLAELPNLQLLVTTGMRNLAIDVAFAKSQGIAVCGTRGFKEPPTELAWALILGLAKNLTTENAHFKSAGPWQSSVGVSLHGKTLGLIGLGQIGQKMARIAKAFGMTVEAWSQNLTAERCAEHGVSLAPSLTQLMGRGDFVSIHVVLSERTQGLIGAQELALMKNSAFLINTSRAAIVDQPALMDCLKSRAIAGAGLDVFEQEPLPPRHPLRSLDNVLATPHLGYVADMNYEAYYHDAAEDIAEFVQGRLLRELS